MSRDEDESVYNIGNGCMVHGDEYMQDCRVCGHEFCMKCNPGASVCPECVDEEAETAEGEPEADEVGEDREVDALLDEADRLDLGEETDEDDRNRERE